MLCVDLYFVEHCDGFRKHFPIEVLAGAVNRDEVARAVDNAWIELRVFEDKGAEELDGDVA